jgi:chromosomal replication initiator protein
MPLGGDQIAVFPMPLGVWQDRPTRPADSRQPAAERPYVLGVENATIAHLLGRILAGEFAELPHPLVIYGHAGVGKTHLARGLAQAVRHAHSLSVAYLTAKAFSQAYSAAVFRDTVERWRETMRSHQLIVIEEVEQLETKRASQRELRYLLDDWQDTGSHALLTSRQPPNLLRGLMPDLRSRLMGGLSLRLLPPEIPARREIVRREMSQFPQAWDESAVLGIAERMASTPRELRTAVACLATPAGNESPWDAETMRRPRRVTLDRIAKQTARHFQVTLADLRSPARRRQVVVARGVVVYLTREMTGLSLDRIGKYLGGRDHSTVLHAWQRTQELEAVDPEVRWSIETLRGKLTD